MRGKARREGTQKKERKGDGRARKQGEQRMIRRKWADSFRKNSRFYCTVAA